MNECGFIAEQKRDRVVDVLIAAQTAQRYDGLRAFFILRLRHISASSRRRYGPPVLWR